MDLTTLCGSGNFKSLLKNCLMYCLLTSAFFSISTIFKMWIDLNLALCLAAKSAYMVSMAPTLVTSLYSLYMLWVPDLDSYLIQTAKFLTVVGLFSEMTFKETISPEAFLTLCNFCKKYQYLDFATTSFGAKILIRYNFGSGTDSVGSLLPITWYSLKRLATVGEKGRGEKE